MKRTVWMLAIALTTALAAPAWAQEDTGPGVVEEQGGLFDAYAVDVDAYLPSGPAGGVMAGVKAVRYVFYPLYVAARLYGGGVIRPAMAGTGTGAFVSLGPEFGTFIGVGPVTFEPSVMVGGLYQTLPSGFGGAVVPKLAVHWHVSDQVALSLNGGYLFAPGVLALGGPLVGVGVAF